MNHDNMTTQLTGHLLIGHHEVAGTAHAYRGFDPSTGRELEPTFSAATPKDVGRAAVLARDAFDAYRATSAGQRADFLESIAAGVESLGEPLIARAMAGTVSPSDRREADRRALASRISRDEAMTHCRLAGASWMALNSMGDHHGNHRQRHSSRPLDTQRSYIQQVSLYARHFECSPDALGSEQVREYQVHLVEGRKLSPSSISIAVSALRFLYKVTLKQPWSSDDIPMPKKPFKLPVILSPEEVMHFLVAGVNYLGRPR